MLNGAKKIILIDFNVFLRTLQPWSENSTEKSEMNYIYTYIFDISQYKTVDAVK